MEEKRPLELDWQGVMSSKRLGWGGRSPGGKWLRSGSKSGDSRDMNNHSLYPGCHTTQAGALWVKSALCLGSEHLLFLSLWDKHVFHSGSQGRATKSRARVATQGLATRVL